MRAAAIAATLFALALHAGGAAAQTWSSSRARPALWQISSVDATGEQGWPYGREDVAGDGLGEFEADEAGSDLRTVYADADGDALFIRAYVAGTSGPPDELIAFFFLDADDRDDTGGDADGADAWPDWDADPSRGGYEYAIGVRGDGTLAGVFEYDAGEWTELTTMPADVQIEVGTDRDPIRIGGLQHGYVQVALAHAEFGFDASCDGNLFVRLWHDGTAQRAFGDDDDEQADCRPREDEFGDPIVLRRDACESDDECPGDGECVRGLCVFGYECTGASDCRPGESCTGGVCVREGGDACDADADCDGLVCEGGECVTCTESGARACGGDAVCAPSGACLSPDAAAAALPPGKVRGGAFECAARTPGPRASRIPIWLLVGLALACAARLRRRSP